MSLDVMLLGGFEDEECFHCGHVRPVQTCLYQRNITHNLTEMACQAGIYTPLWHPEDVEITTAKQLIRPLVSGLAVLIDDPERFRKFNPANGWGSYEALIDFVGDYLSACRDHPDAEVRVSR